MAHCGHLTGVLGLCDNLGKKLSEVGEVVLQEAGADNEGLAGVTGSQLATKELGLAVDAQGRSFLGVLLCSVKLQTNLGSADRTTHLEGKRLKTNGQTGKRLVTGTGLGNNGELGGRTMSVPGSYLEAIGIGSFKGTRGGGGGEASLLGRAHAAGPARGLLRVSRESRSRDHVWVSWRRQLIEP